MNKSIIEKLKKIRALSVDSGASEDERKTAFEMYTKLKEKYNVELENEVIKTYSILTKNEFERTILYGVLLSFNLEAYTMKTQSKRRLFFETSASIYTLIEDDFNFHKEKITEILKGIIVKYCHTQIFIPKKNSSDEEEENEVDYSPEFLKAYFSNTWLENEEYSTKKKISY